MQLGDRRGGVVLGDWSPLVAAELVEPARRGLIAAMDNEDASHASRISQRIVAQLPNLMSGSVRIWGRWFGRPYDNVHRVTVSEAADELLTVRFDAGEVLKVWEPDGEHIAQDRFEIASAARVRWEWFYYGRPKTPENLYFIDTRLGAGRDLTVETNVDWFPVGGGEAARPAFELL